MGIVLPMTVISEWSFPAFISTHKPPIMFFLPCPAEEGGDGAALVSNQVSPCHEHRWLCLPSIPCYRREDAGAVIGGEDLAISWKSALIEQIFMDLEV